MGSESKHLSFYGFGRVLGVRTTDKGYSNAELGLIMCIQSQNPGPLRSYQGFRV